MKPSSKTLRLGACLLSFKIAYLGLLSAVLLAWPVPRSEGMFPGAMLLTTSSGNLTFASHFGTWDAEHYLILSKTGYRKGIAQCAFYPLWPYLVKGFAAFTGGSHVLSGLFLANAFSLAGWLVFFRLVAERLGESVAGLSLILLIAFPGALFFQFIYSESLFFLLLMLLCLGLEQNRFGLTLLTAILLPLSRAVGVFCVFPILWYLLFQARRPEVLKPPGGKAHAPVPVGNSPTGMAAEVRTKSLGRLVERLRAVLVGGRGFWLLLAPLFGWAVYFALMWVWTGNPLEGFKAQKQWGNVESIGNIFNFPKFVMEFCNPTCWHGFTGSVLDRCMFVLLAWCLPVIWHLDKGWFIWTCVLGIVPAMSGTFTSFTRFEAVAFPLFIALAVLLLKPGLRWFRWGTLTAFALLHLILLWRFVNFRWAG